MNLSTWSVVILVGVALGAVGYLLGALVLPGGSGSTTANKGPGLVYETPMPVADFTLTDQTGTPFTFSSSQGKVVLMAFLFTHCADVCPFSAIKMRQALELMGEQGKNVELVVVSTDPERDTVPVLADYSRDLGLYDKWHMVTGSLAELQKVYASLKITVVKSTEEEEHTVKHATDLGVELPQKDVADSPVFGLTDAQMVAGSNVAKKYSGGYYVAHAAPFWVVDPQGRVRTSLDVSATPAQLVEAIKTYLNS